jgi:hypothetical protein
MPSTFFCPVMMRITLEASFPSTLALGVNPLDDKGA